MHQNPAAFRRLCVETLRRTARNDVGCQPPSGGCVLKPYPKSDFETKNRQPPSGGCVLKPPRQGKATHQGYPAAFRRLCVETSIITTEPLFSGPAAFRRLCVETKGVKKTGNVFKPAAFRRLCVETSPFLSILQRALPAAFRRLCVET